MLFVVLAAASAGQLKQFVFSQSMGWVLLIVVAVYLALCVSSAKNKALELIFELVTTVLFCIEAFFTILQQWVWANPQTGQIIVTGGLDSLPHIAVTVLLAAIVFALLYSFRAGMDTIRFILQVLILILAIAECLAIASGSVWGAFLYH